MTKPNFSLFPLVSLVRILLNETGEANVEASQLWRLYRQPDLDLVCDISASAPPSVLGSQACTVLLLPLPPAEPCQEQGAAVWIEEQRFSPGSCY